MKKPTNLAVTSIMLRKRKCGYFEEIFVSASLELVTRTRWRLVKTLSQHQ